MGVEYLGKSEDEFTRHVARAERVGSNAFAFLRDPARQKLPATLSRRARQYHRQYGRIVGRDYLGLAENDFVAHVIRTVNDEPEGEAFAFLR
jgi:hypothetical protein